MKTEHETGLNFYLARRRRRRSAIIIAGIFLLGCVIGLTFLALRGTAGFFRVPSDITTADRTLRRPLRLGGYVEKGTVERGPGTGVRFSVTDFRRSEPVRYNGILPDLFREGQGVVAEGRFDETGIFIADRVLARHDERYVPKDLADRLKAQGLWEDHPGRDH